MSGISLSSICVVVVLLATPLSASRNETNLRRKECPDGFVLYEDIYCFLRDDYKYWTQSAATNLCAEKGATQPYPTGDIETWLGAVGVASGGWRLWSGAKFNNGVWQWVDGSPVTPEAWLPSEPWGQGDCAIIDSTGSEGYLRDWICTYLVPVLCQVAPRSTIEIDKILDSTVPTFDGGEADKTIDDNIETHWNVADRPQNYNNWYMAFKLKKRYTVTSIELHNSGDTTHDITSFKLEASDDGNTWRVIKTWSDEVFSGLKSFDDFTATGSYLKFTVTKTLSGYQPWLREISFDGYLSDQETTTAIPPITQTEAPPTTPGTGMCYSCIGCHDVDSADTNIVAENEDQSCFTAIYENSNLVIRGVAPELHSDGECMIDESVATCFCNSNLCNAEHVPEKLAHHSTKIA